MALVVFLFAPGQGQLDFGLAIFEIHPQRDEIVAHLVDLAIELFDLGLVQQQFALTTGLVIIVVGKGIGADVDVEHPDFIVDNASVAVFEVAAPISEGFDLGSPQHHAGLELILDVIVVPGFAVFSDDFDAFRAHGVVGPVVRVDSGMRRSPARFLIPV